MKFHDGSEMTSKDVKASYDKIVFPPPNVDSQRKGQYTNVEAIEAPDASTIVFRLKWTQASFLASLASPYNWIYQADDPRQGHALVREERHGDRPLHVRRST